MICEGRAVVIGLRVVGNDDYAVLRCVGPERLRGGHAGRSVSEDHMRSDHVLEPLHLVVAQTRSRANAVRAVMLRGSESL